MLLGVFAPGCGETTRAAVDAGGTGGAPDATSNGARDARVPDAAPRPDADASPDVGTPADGAPTAPPDLGVAPPDLGPAGPDAALVERDAATPPPSPDAALEPPVASDYDVATDFSPVSNPNGLWSFRAGDVPVPLFTNDWAGVAGQSAWASAPGLENGFTPAFMIVTSPDTGFVDVALGDFVVHSQDDGSGFGFGPARVVFTAPTAGTLDVAGAVWPGRDIGRADHWSLSLAGAILAFGSLADGDTYDRAHPFEFSSAADRPLTGLPVEAGDELVLEIVRDSDFGDAVGVRMAVTVTE